MFVFSFLCNLTDMFLWLKWMYCIDIIPIGVLKGNIHVLALTTNPLCRPSLMPAWLQNEIKHYCHELVKALMRILLAVCVIYVSWVLANMITMSSYCFWKCDRNPRCRCLYNYLSEILGKLWHTYLHQLLGVNEVSAELDTAIYDEVEALISRSHNHNVSAIS